MSGLRVLACGGRDYADREKVYEVLDEVRAASGISVLIEGEAAGADTLAKTWALRRGVPVERYPADWTKYGRGAGPIRNQRMLDEGRPDLVVAFPGGRGTADMVDRAKAAGVPVMVLIGRRP